MPNDIERGTRLVLPTSIDPADTDAMHDIARHLTPAELVRNQQAFHAAYQALQPYTQHAHVRGDIADHAVCLLVHRIHLLGQSIDGMQVDTDEGAAARRPLVDQIRAAVGSLMTAATVRAADAAVQAAAGVLAGEG